VRTPHTRNCWLEQFTCLANLVDDSRI
jgi:hypothetical protein